MNEDSGEKGNYSSWRERVPLSVLWAVILPARGKIYMDTYMILPPFEKEGTPTVVFFEGWLWDYVGPVHVVQGSGLLFA